MALLFDAPTPFVLPVEGRGAYPVRRIFCIGRNYAAHAAEMGNVVDQENPFFFTKSPAHAVHPGDWRYPPGSGDVHHEVELVIAMGGSGVLAAGVGLDMTRRDLQATCKDKRHPWDVAKDFEGAAILAPMRVVDDLDALDIALDVNGEARQSGNTRDLIQPIPAILSYLGALYKLGPGDLVMTGTPSGVGPVVRGDRLTGRIDGLPDLQITVV
ncbi:Fumarylpyruvate hydrolase [Rhodobacteraceae bacterium THAF1]|uniref:fumarylacetoacetate hydrolase family protein n=1 Tax=Palleronia sp. THAF1 TaxID=2587842 RepID=UPI000F3E56F7|nr:fumarylacetoacetate hydrolase family protein [Palleronia sp. THAF1]QFU08193.1 Fumarylpyruvate hydrolase [Palleronia sp. THAF1]VDC28747.1 Fumarylpyruvate hydrolase [Rhodobacteraceae bacterium THAF1]